LTLSNIFGVSLKNRMVDSQGEYTAGERRPVKRAECYGILTSLNVFADSSVLAIACNAPSTR
jgi:hypothetical protein